MFTPRFLFSICALSLASESFAQHLRENEAKTPILAVAVPDTARNCKDLARRYPATQASSKTVNELRSNWKRVQKDYADLSRSTGKSIDPLKIKDVVARRFINPPDWINYLETNPTVIKPEDVYEPKPLAFNNWSATAFGPVKELAQKKEPIKLSQLLRWNKGALLGTLPSHVKIGQLKDQKNYGRNILKREALNASQIRNLASLGLKFVPLVCKEDLPAQVNPDFSQPECADIRTNSQKHKSPFWSSVATDFASAPMDREKFSERWYWYACWPRASMPNAAGQSSCGMFLYPESKQSARGLKDILKETALFESCLAKKDVLINELAYIADIQRRVVALHPFNKGNGRLSRWIMDTLGARSGLPPLLVKDMNADLSTPFSEHVNVVSQATHASLQKMRDCLEGYRDKNASAHQKSNCGQLGGDK